MSTKSTVAVGRLGMIMQTLTRIALFYAYIYVGVCVCVLSCVFSCHVNVFEMMLV